MKIGNGNFVMLWMALEAGIAALNTQLKTSLVYPVERQFRNTPQQQPLHQVQQRSCKLF